MPILALIADAISEDVDRLTDFERDRLFSLAIVRGFRIQSNRRSGLHAIMRVTGQAQHVYPERYPSKKAARRALLRLMLALRF